MGYKSLQINISPIRWNTLKIWLNTLQTMVWYIWIFLKLHLKQFLKMSLWHWHKYPAQCYILVKRIHTFINLFLFDYLKTESRTYTVRTNDTYMAVKLNYFFLACVCTVWLTSPLIVVFIHYTLLILTYLFI